MRKRGVLRMSFIPDSTFEVNEPTVISETIDGETIIINLDERNLL